jgi:membrane protease YdiL (CAAX protease family)
MIARVSFGSILWRIATTWLVLIFTMVLGRAASSALGDGPGALLIFRGIAPSLVVLVLIVTFEGRFHRTGLRASLLALGLGRPNPMQLRVAAVSTIPILLAYGTIFFGLGASAEHERPLALYMIKYAVGQGLAEELCFRGFVFRLLRPGRSFARAALSSGTLFAIVHLTSLLKGFSTDNLLSVGFSTLYAFVLAFPFALLFERGGNSIWGVAFVHWAIDSNTYFPALSKLELPLAVYLGLGVFGCVAVITYFATLRTMASAEPAPE